MVRKLRLLILLFFSETFSDTENPCNAVLAQWGACSSVGRTALQLCAGAKAVGTPHIVETQHSLLMSSCIFDPLSSVAFYSLDGPPC